MPKPPRKKPTGHRPAVIAVEGRKGGTGKSTVSVALLTELQARGYDVLGLDCDPQHTLMRWVNVAAIEKRHPPRVMDTGDPRLVASAFSAYDAVIIDCAGRLDETQLAALRVATLCILPCLPSPTDLWALQESVEMVRAVQAQRPELELRVLLNRAKPRQVLTRLARSAIHAAKYPLCVSELGDRSNYPESLAAGAGPSTWKPQSPAAADVRALVDELLPLMRTTWQRDAALATASLS